MTSKPLITYKQIRRTVKKLRLDNKSLLLIKAGSALANMRSLDMLVEQLRASGKEKVLIAIVDDFDDISVIDKKTMNESGWFHVDTVAGYRKKGNQTDD